MSPLRFLALHAGDELYGSDRVFHDLLVGLDRERFEPVAVLPRDVPGGGALSRRLLAAGVDVRRRRLAVLRRRYLRPAGLTLLAARLAADLLGLARLARRLRCELVYTSTTAVPAGALVARLLGLPHVWHVHEIVGSPAPLSRLLRSGLGLSAEVLAVSRAVAGWVGPQRCPVTVVHNGLDEPRPPAGERAALRERLLRGRRGPLVGWVSRVSDWKGHPVFVEMAERVAERHSEAAFVLAGGAVPGRPELVSELERRLSRSPHSERIQYLGEVADGPRLVAALDVLVACPTRPDPFPRVVEEALWHGVPVLAVATGGLPELVADGRTGRLVAAADPGLLSDALEGLLDPGVRAAMGRCALETSARFSLPVFVETISGILERAASARRAPGSGR